MHRKTKREGIFWKKNTKNLQKLKTDTKVFVQDLTMVGLGIELDLLISGPKIFIQNCFPNFTYHYFHFLKFDVLI